MTEIIKFEDWVKFELRVGEIKKVGKKVIINYNNRDFEAKLDLDVNKGDQIVVGISRDNLILPVVKDNITLVPEKQAEIGWKIS